MNERAVRSGALSASANPLLARRAAESALGAAASAALVDRPAFLDVRDALDDFVQRFQ